MTIVPELLAGGVTTKVKWVESTMVVLAAAVPFVTTTSPAWKTLMGWLKVNVKVTGPVTAVVLVHVMATVGAGGAVPEAGPPPPPQSRSRDTHASIDRRSFILNGSNGLNGGFPKGRFHPFNHFIYRDLTIIKLNI